MKKGNGFTLVEAMVVLVIFTLIISMGIPAFSTWSKKQKAESQISKLFSDLQYARMKAYSEKKAWGVYWGGSNPFSSYSVKKDANDDGDVNDPSGTDEIVSSVSLEQTISSNITPSIDFDNRGLCNNNATLYVPASNGAANDCISVARTRLIIGKWDGSDCIPK